MADDGYMPANQWLPCMVDVARYFLNFTMAESCGRCTPCREGTRIMVEILTRIIKGKAGPEDAARLEEIAIRVKGASLCGLEQTCGASVNPGQFHRLM